MIEVVLADDQALVREGLRLMLEAEPDLRVVGEAASGAEAVSVTRRRDPDVVLMDVRMPQLDGIEATRRIAASGSRARVLILTTFDLDDYVYRAMKAGASGFLLKDVRREQLTAAVRAVVAGDQILAPSITRRLVETFCAAPPGGSGADDLGLSPRELEVVRLIAEGMSNGEIAARLHLAPTTVKSHVARILTKLDLRDRVHIAVLAYERRLVEPGRRVSSSPHSGP